MNILLVEDDENLRTGLVELFELESFNVCSTDNAKHALALLEAFTPDVCVFDVMLPGASGLSLCKQLRSQCDAPVLFLSARHEENDRIRGFEVGAEDYVCKPFNSVELIHRIKALYRRSFNARMEVSPVEPAMNDLASFCIGDLLVETSSLRAFRGKIIIDLTDRECRILRVLEMSKNHVVRKSQLYELCWGLHFIPESRALDQYISALRVKIELNPQKPTIIQTVRGSGYRYESK